MSAQGFGADAASVIQASALGRVFGSVDQKQGFVRVVSLDEHGAVGFEDDQATIFDRDRAEVVDAEREVFDRRVQFASPDPVIGRDGAADAVALLNDRQAEGIGTDRQVSDRDEVEIEFSRVVITGVVKDDPAIGRGGDPTGQGPQDAADAGDLRRLTQAGAVGREHAQAVATIDRADPRRIVQDGQNQGRGVFVGRRDRLDPTRARTEPPRLPAERARAAFGATSACGSSSEPSKSTRTISPVAMP